MSKHTPGRWKHDKVHGLIMAGTIEIAACHAGRGGDAEANARLISAAPELLRLAKSIVKEWKGTFCPTMSRYIEKARPVIEKAEGKS